MAKHHVTAPSSNIRARPYPTSHPNTNTAHTVASVGPAQPSGHRTHPTNTSVSRTGPWWGSPGPLRSHMRVLAQHDSKTVFNQSLAREVMIFGKCIRCRPGVCRHHRHPLASRTTGSLEPVQTSRKRTLPTNSSAPRTRPW